MNLADMHSVQDMLDYIEGLVESEDQEEIANFKAYVGEFFGKDDLDFSIGYLTGYLPFRIFDKAQRVLGVRHPYANGDMLEKHGLDRNDISVNSLLVAGQVMLLRDNIRLPGVDAVIEYEVMKNGEQRM